MPERSLSWGRRPFGDREPALPKAVQAGGAVAGSGAPPPSVTVGPARVCAAGYVGYHSSWRCRRPAPQAGAADSRGRSIYSFMFRWSTVNFCVFGGSQAPAPNRRLPESPGEHCSPRTQVPPPPESSASAFLGLTRTGRWGIVLGANGARWSGAGVGAPGRQPVATCRQPELPGLSAFGPEVHKPGFSRM